MTDAGTGAPGHPHDPGGTGGVQRSSVEAMSLRTLAARAVETVGLGLASLLVVALVWQWLDVHLTFFGTLPEPTPGDGVRYVVTASACVVLATAGLLAALAAGHPRVAALGVVVLVVAVAAASLLAVPSDRWAREPVDRPAPAYEPCFSGSGDCVGG